MTKTYEEREQAQAAIRAHNNNTITHGQLWDKHKGKARRQVPPIVHPIPPAKTFTAAEWAQVSEILGRIGTVLGTMESDAGREDFRLVAARLPIMGDEYIRLTRALIGDTK